MPKVKLTDRFVAAAKPAAPGKRVDYHDTVVPGLALRLTDRGHRSWVLHGRFPRTPEIASRLHVGNYPAVGLDDARTTARAWQQMAAQGKDPRTEIERQARQEARDQECLVKAVVEEFIREKLPGERKGKEVARSLRRDFVPVLGDRPVTKVERIDIRNLVKEKRRDAPAQARNLLGDVKRFFRWVVNQETYGLDTSPCAEIQATEMLGEKPRGERHLSDDELFAVWRAAARFPYPYREIYQLLTLNALRLNEVARAANPEFDYRGRLWTIPKERMKGKNGQARPHVVPLIQPNLDILASLPALTKGPYLFSLTGGKTPVGVGSKVKARLDARVLRILKALARKRGQDPSTVTLEPFTNHDIRRTVRTNLSPLRDARGMPLADEVKEAVIAHARPGVKGVYDKFQYLDEKQEALELWAAKLNSIVRPRPAQVILLSERRAAQWTGDVA